MPITPMMNAAIHMRKGYFLKLLESIFLFFNQILEMCTYIIV